MKTVVLSGPKRVLLEEREIPVPGPDEVLVKVKYCGICGSDVHAYVDATFPPGTVLGHEFCGTIEKVGDHVRGWATGDRVVVRAAGTCGRCFWCRKGEICLCTSHLPLTVGFGKPGAFAEYVVVGEHMLVHLPDTVSDEEGALVEPLAVCLHATEKADVTLGDNVLIYGAGPIGLLMYQCLKASGAGQIFVIEKSESRRSLARALGCQNVIDPERSDVRQLANDLPRKGFDKVVECAGAASTIREAFQTVRTGGRIVFVGVNSFDISLNHFDWVTREIEVRASMGYHIGHFEDAVRLIEDKTIDVRRLVSHIIRLEEIDERGFQCLLQPNDSVKILVTP